MFTCLIIKSYNLHLKQFKAILYKHKKIVCDILAFGVINYKNRLNY